MFYTRFTRKYGRFLTFIIVAFLIGYFTFNWGDSENNEINFINQENVEALQQQNVMENVVKKDTDYNHQDDEIKHPKNLNNDNKNVNLEVQQRGEHHIENVELQIEENKESVLTIPKPTLSPDILELHRRLNLTDPGQNGRKVELPKNLDLDIQLMINASYEKYRINEFIANLVPLDRTLPDVRSEYCKQQVYSQNLPVASVIMVLHNEPLSMILRTIYSILNRSPEHLIKEIVLIDDCSTYGKKESL
jgi:hypothetical protein